MLGLNLGLGVYRGQQSLTARAISTLRRLGATLIGVNDNLVGTYIDSAGTTPVTAVGDLVGLTLDRMGTVGPDRVTNGDNETSLFSIQGGIVSSDTIARASAPGGGFAASSTSTTATSSAHRLYAISPMLAGKAYRLSGRFYVPTGGVGTFKIYDNADGSWFGVSSTIKDQWVNFSVIRTAKASNWDLGIGDNVSNVLPSGQISFWIDDLSICELTGNHATQATPASKPLVGINAQGKKVISFDGSNDFLQTGITTGNEGWVCAGVTFGGAAAALETVTYGGGGGDTVKGVWLARVGSAGENQLWCGVSDGTTRNLAVVSSLPLRNVPRVVSGGWTASSVMAGVDATEVTAARTNGTAAPGIAPLAIGGTSSAFLNGPLTATVISPVLPSAADRALLRKWIGSLQGQTL
jgi:hypothetical protein